MEIIVHGTLVDFLVGYGAYILCFGLAIVGVVPAIGAAGGAMNLLSSRGRTSHKEKKSNWLFLIIGTSMALGLWALSLFIAKWAFLELS